MEYQEGTTFLKPPATFDDDKLDPVVNTFLKIIDESVEFNGDHFDTLDKINDVLTETYSIDGYDINPTLLSQCLDLLIAKTKPLDIRVENLKAGHTVNYNVSKATYEVMKKGGYIEMLRNGKGGFFKTFSFGDFFSLVRANSKTGLPEFLDTSLRNCYFDSFATKLITKSGTKATYLCIVSEYSWNTAISTFPGIEKVATTGRLPIGTRYFMGGNLDMNDEQKVAREKNLVEIALCFDISDVDNPRSVTIAGPGASIVPKTLKEGEKYEYYFGKWGKKNYEPYLPVLQFICKQYGNGMYNRGFGHLLYKYSKILSKMQTKFVKYTDKNFDPTVVYNLPYKQGNNVAKKIENADRLRQNGKSPIVVNEYTNASDISPIKIETLQTREMTADYERLKEDINRDIRRWGLNLDLYYTEIGKTATAVVTEDVTVNLAIQALQEINTATYEMAVRIAMDICKKNLSKGDKTPFTFQPKVLLEDGTEVDMDREFTYGDYKQLLDKYNFNVVVDSKSGTYPSPIFSNKVAAQFTNSLLQIGEVDAAKKLIQDSAQDFGLQFNITRKQQNPNPLQQPGVSANAQTPQIQDLMQTQARTQDLLS